METSSWWGATSVSWRPRFPSLRLGAESGMPRARGSSCCRSRRWPTRGCGGGRGGASGWGATSGCGAGCGRPGTRGRRSSAHGRFRVPNAPPRPPKRCADTWPTASIFRPPGSFRRTSRSRWAASGSTRPRCSAFLDRCDAARYAPGAHRGGDGDWLAEAARWIDTLEASR